MWVFSRSSFLSLIADPVDPDCLLVRARIRTDIHHLWPKAIVDVTPLSQSPRPHDGHP
jgi:hypothetical protein